jgi:hypothetical protein
MDSTLVLRKLIAYNVAVSNIDFEKLKSLQERVSSGESTDFPTIEHRYKLDRYGPGSSWQFTYRPGYPFRLILSFGDLSDGSPGLEIGRVDDLNLESLKGLNVDFAIIDRTLAQSRRGLLGIKGLKDGERVVLGRSTPRERFRFPGEVSRRHVEVTRERCGGDDLISFKDLGSSSGTVVEVSDLHFLYK